MGPPSSPLHPTNPFGQAQEALQADQKLELSAFHLLGTMSWCRAERVLTSAGEEEKHPVAREPREDFRTRYNCSKMGSKGKPHVRRDAGLGPLSGLLQEVSERS